MTRASAHAALVLGLLLSTDPTWAQTPTPTGAGEVAIAGGGFAYTVARLMDGRLVTTGPCVAAEGPLDEGQGWRVTVSGPVQALSPRQVAVGSEEWNRVAPRVLALADRREREQRLATASTSRVPRFLDWLYASDAKGGPTYYFETSRRVPSPPADPDAADTDPPGTLRIAVSGFALLDATTATPLGTKGELRWEEDGRPRGPIRPDLRPLGVVVAAGEVVWVMEGPAPGASAISLVSVGAGGTAIVAATRIGRC